jgi:RNA polymerase sigma-70 factor (ECF subfamily)
MSEGAPPVVGRTHGDAVMLGRVGSAADRDRLDEAYSSLFRDQFPRVAGTIGLMVRDRAKAEDIAQEAFLRLYRDWRRLSAYDRPDLWVRRVAIRLAMRSLARDRLWELIRFRMPDPTADHAADPDVMAAIARLSRAQRAAVTLYYYEGRPTEEIASILGCTAATVRVHLHVARQRLGQMLAEVTDRVP